MRSEESVAAKVLTWNLPARVTHWGFALSFSASLWIGFFNDPEGTVFKFHILAGVLALWFLVLRVMIGFFGSRTMRWSGFFHSPVSFARYVVRVFAWKRMEFVGLNPGSALFAQLIYIGLVGLLWTGFVAEWVETWHGRIAWGTIGLIGLHLLGLLLHALRHRGDGPLAMVHGWERRSDPVGVLSQNILGGIILLICSVVVAWALVHFFDEGTAILSIPGLPEVVFPFIQKG